MCENLQMEFEILASESPAKAQTFLDELNEKVSGMADFKKLWLKFSMQTEAYVKKDVTLPVMVTKLYNIRIYMQ